MPDDNKPLDDNPLDDNQTLHEDGVYEMLWDCKFCGTEKLLGKTQKFCPTCGATQDPEWRYFPSDEEKIAVKDHIFVGEDKTCGSCGTLLAGNVEFCTRCGAPQTEAAIARKLVKRTANLGQAFVREDRDARQVAEARGLNVKQPEKKGFPRWAYALIGVGVLVVGFILFSIFAKRDVVGTVESFAWERNISIEEFRSVPSRSLCSSMPLDAYGVSRSYEQVGSRSVPDGETCSSQQVDQGDGTFRQQRVCTTKYRDEPVMDYMCSYAINRWTAGRTASSTGDKNKPLAWPIPNLKCGGTGTSLGCERESERNEKYVFNLSAGDKKYSCDVPFAMWDSARIEQAFEFKVGMVFDNPDCGTIKPKSG